MLPCLMAMDFGFCCGNSKFVTIEARFPLSRCLEIARRNSVQKRSDAMQTFKLVMPENLNHFGVLFGGYILKWVDEIAWVAASLDYSKCRFVTIAMDKVEFKHSVRQGTILRFEANRVRQGNTSVNYEVLVFRDHDSDRENAIFSTTVTMVNVDDNGQKIPVTPAEKR